MQSSRIANVVLWGALVVAAGCGETATSPALPPAVGSLGSAPLSVGGGASSGAMSSTGISATVLAVTFAPGSNHVGVVIAIPRAINANARAHGAPFGIETSVTYRSSTNTLETLASGPKSIAGDTEDLYQLNRNTDVIQLNVPFGSLPVFGSEPDARGTAHVIVM